jgi:hypothetical protein
MNLKSKVEEGISSHKKRAMENRISTPGRQPFWVQGKEAPSFWSF